MSSSSQTNDLKNRILFTIFILGIFINLTEVLANVIRIPRTAQLTTSYGSENWATTVLVQIKTDEGVTCLLYTSDAADE